MKRTILSLLVAGMFAGVGTSAMSQVNTTGAEDQPAATTQGMTPQSDSSTQNPAVSAANQTTPTDPALEGNAQSISNPDTAAALESAKAKCDVLQGDAKSACVTDATMAPSDTLADADTQSDPVGEANAAAGQESGNDGMGNASGSPT